MIVFKTFLKILKSCKIPIIMYTAFLIGFGGLNMKTSENNLNFTETKPNILIVNNDEEKGITKNLIEYIKENSNLVNVKDSEDARNDALFYREINYIIYIPKNYRNDFLNNKNPKIEIKKTRDYNSELTQILLEKYINTANIYKTKISDETKLLEKINETLNIETKIELTTTLDTNKLEKTTFYYNFMNYSLLAGLVYVICLIISSFNEEKVKKRTIISSFNYKKYNYYLLLSNGLFAITLWLIYILLGFVLLGNILIEPHGIIYILNSFIFMICSLTIAFLIANLIKNKNTINGIINVIALGSSFICGAFVPMELLPTSVLKIGHILPSYWYIKTNEMLKNMEIINIQTLKPIIINMIIILLFSILFIVLNNIITKKRRKLN